MKRKRGVESCQHGLKVEITRDHRGQSMGARRYELSCAIGQFKGPKLSEYCKSVCPKYEPRDDEA